MSNVKQNDLAIVVTGPNTGRLVLVDRRADPTTEAELNRLLELSGRWWRCRAMQPVVAFHVHEGGGGAVSSTVEPPGSEVLFPHTSLRPLKGEPEGITRATEQPVEEHA